MRPLFLSIWSSLAVLAFVAPVHAGLYYSGEKYAELPSQWRGFLLDQRNLRTIAAAPSAFPSQRFQKEANRATPLRKRYQAELEKLTKQTQQRRLTADEAADLGALHLRLGDSARAIEILRSAQRDNPQHFRLMANLGTAWQMQGDLRQAAACLEQAVRLAPAHLRKAEQLHLQLVRFRAQSLRQTAELDDLFGIQYVGPNGRFEPGRLDPLQRQHLPDDAVALVQQLALWLPADGRLLWQLGELAGVSGDVATAAAILDGCVTELGLRSPLLQEHRRAYRAAAEQRTKSGAGTQNQHQDHTRLFKPRSPHPLLSKLDPTPLPPIDPNGVNVLPWSVVTETTLDHQYRPTFPRYLKELDGKQVTLNGYLQPLGEDAEWNAFLFVEYPIGCWYCEQPEATAIILVELPSGKTYPHVRSQVCVRGKLVLNATDPENFLYTIRNAEIRSAEPQQER